MRSPRGAAHFLIVTRGTSDVTEVTLQVLRNAREEPSRNLLGFRVLLEHGSEDGSSWHLDHSNPGRRQTAVRSVEAGLAKRGVQKRAGLGRELQDDRPRAVLVQRGDVDDRLPRARLRGPVRSGAVRCGPMDDDEELVERLDLDLAGNPNQRLLAASILPAAARARQ